MTSSTPPKLVLIAEGAEFGLSRAALAAARLLGRSGYSPVVTSSGPFSLAATSRFVDRVIRVPPVLSDPMGFAEAVSQELARSAYLAVLPVSDLALLALRPELVDLVDKSLLTQRLISAGFEPPPSVFDGESSELAALADHFDYPVVVKPALKTSLAQLAKTPEELLDVVPAGRVIVQPYLDDRLTGVIGLMWNGRLRAAVRFSYGSLWPAPLGTVATAVSVDLDAELEQKLESLLAEYSGPFHVDMVGSHVIDVNLRIHALLPAAARAGVDIPVLLCRLIEGEEPAAVRARKGVRFRWEAGSLRRAMWDFQQQVLGPKAILERVGPVRGFVPSLLARDDLRPAIAYLRHLWSIRHR